MGSDSRSADRLPPDPLGSTKIDLNGLKPKGQTLELPQTPKPLSSYDLLKPGGQPRLSDSLPQTRPNDRLAQGDQNIRQPVNGVMEVRYGEADFDKVLAQKNYHTLRIKDMPPNVEIKSWVDDKGGFNFWFKNGNDHRAPHYFGENVQKIVVDYTVGQDGKQYKPLVKLADEIRVSASQAYLAEKNGVGFASYNNATDPFTYARRMSNVAMQSLDLQEKMLRQGADASPSNPYFKIYLADVLTAQAVKPIIDSIQSGQPIRFDNPQTIAKIDAAIAELRKAQEVSARVGGHRIPNTQMQPPLHPFGLNPNYYNPDFYWSGAAYQSYRREVSLVMMKSMIQSGVLNNFELPPNMRPR